MDNKQTNNGIGFFGALTLIFIVLKLLGVINWSWIWVLSPVWISILIAVMLIVFAIWQSKKG